MSNRIRELRKKCGLSQDQLASQVETTAQQIGHLEAGKRQLTQAWMERLAPALGCRPTDLFSSEGDQAVATGDLAMPEAATRTGMIERRTNETKIRVAVGLDGTGVYKVDTGIGFLDHMLEQLSRHSLIDLEVEAKGDLHIDFHHTTEDTGIAIGEAFSKALGERKGIARYGSALVPMDETLTRVALDISNRPYLIWRVAFSRPKLGDMDTELFKEWFQAFAQAAGVTLHVETLYGENNHHIVESCYKALARALRQAVEIDPRKADAVPSTKGVLGGSL